MLTKLVEIEVENQRLKLEGGAVLYRTVDKWRDRRASEHGLSKLCLGCVRKEGYNIVCIFHI